MMTQYKTAALIKNNGGYRDEYRTETTGMRRNVENT